MRGSFFIACMRIAPGGIPKQNKACLSRPKMSYRPLGSLGGTVPSTLLCPTPFCSPNSAYSYGSYDMYLGSFSRTCLSFVKGHVHKNVALGKV